MLRILGYYVLTVVTPFISLPSNDVDSFPITNSLYVLDHPVFFDSLLNDSVLASFVSNEPGHQWKEGWVYLQLKNESKDVKKIYLEITNTVYFDRIELFKRQRQSFKSLGVTGDPIHHSLRPTKDHELVFVVNIPPRSFTDYLLYIKSPFKFRPEARIWSYEAFNNRKNQDNLVYVFMYGLLTFVMVFSFFLAILFKDQRIYFFYSLYLLCMLLIYLHINGFGYEFLWPHWPEFDKRMPFVAISLSMIFLLKFTEKFLPIHQLTKRVQGLFKLTFYGMCFSTLLSQFIFIHPWFYKSYLVGSIFFLNLFFYILAWYTAYKSYRNGFKPALFYLFAFLTLFTGIILFLSRSFTSLPVQFWVGQHAIQIGNIFEIIILTWGLAYWFKVNNDEKQLLLIQVNTQQQEISLEKERIAQELHDNIGTQLTSLSLGLNRLTKSDTYQKGSLQALYKHTNDTILDLRDTIWVINKNEVQLSEVIDKVSNLIWRLRQQDETVLYAFTVTDPAPVVTLHPTTAINLFRIIQEAVNNSLKHSDAKKISIRMTLTNGAIDLRVIDDGKGFDPKKISSLGHYGLANMRKRAVDISAILTIASQPGNGTDVWVHIAR